MSGLPWGQISEHAEKLWSSRVSSDAPPTWGGARSSAWGGASERDAFSPADPAEIHQIDKTAHPQTRGIHVFRRRRSRVHFLRLRGCVLQVSSPFLIRHDSATPTVRRHALVRMGAPSGPACRSASPDASSRAPGRARTPAWPQGLCRIAPAPPPRRSASSRLPRTPGQAPPLPFQHAFTAEAALHQHEDEWSAGVQLHDGGSHNSCP